MQKAWLLRTDEDHKLVQSDWQINDIKEYSKRHPKSVYRLTPIVTTRTLPQNSLYWVFLDKIAEETGNLPEDLHLYFKSTLLPRKIVTIKGKKNTYTVERLTSTRDLNKIDFGEYMDKISSITGVAIPDPIEAGYLPNR